MAGTMDPWINRMGARDEGIHGATVAEAEGITALMMPIKWSRPGGTWCGSGLLAVRSGVVGRTAVLVVVCGYKGRQVVSRQAVVVGICLEHSTVRYSVMRIGT